MIWTKIKRVLRAGFINFWRNSFISLSSILVMFITLFVIGSVLFMSAMLDTSLEALKDKVDINVYFVTSAQESDILAIQDEVKRLLEVETIQYISREKALEAFKKRHENDELTLQALEELGENPLGAALNIKAQNPSQYEAVIKFLEKEDGLANGRKNIIEKINYEDNRPAIEKLDKIITASERLGFAITIILIVISVIITFNTIRLVIYTAREEIAVMRLVGASSKYVRGPFVVSGMLYGLVAALITLIIFYPLLYWLGPKTASFFIGINLFSYYLSNFFGIALILILAGIVMGGLSSYLAVRRYLTI